MNDNEEFYTVRGYAIQDQGNKALTPSMEDYLEMIYRLSLARSYIRIVDLAHALNVQPPSATRMVQKLAEVKCVHYKKYGIIELTNSGSKIGEILLRRHNTLEVFLKYLGVKGNILEDTEKIEHYLSNETLQCIISFVDYVNLNPKYLEPYQHYLQKKFKNNESL